MFKSKWQITAFWGLLALILDLVTKSLACDYLNPWASVSVVPGFFDLILTFNTGAAFSLFSSNGGEGHGLKMALVAGASLLPFIYFYLRAINSDRTVLVSLGLIWGGALGNIHDRLRWGAVVDFLDFYWGANHWPAFNLADVFICLGAVFLALAILREKPRHQ